MLTESDKTNNQKEQIENKAKKTDENKINLFNFKIEQKLKSEDYEEAIQNKQFHDFIKSSSNVFEKVLGFSDKKNSNSNSSNVKKINDALLNTFDSSPIIDLLKNSTKNKSPKFEILSFLDNNASSFIKQTSSKMKSLKFLDIFQIKNSLCTLLSFEFNLITHYLIEVFQLEQSGYVQKHYRILSNEKPENLNLDIKNSLVYFITESDTFQIYNIHTDTNSPLLTIHNFTSQLSK
jgi:hypothetical protein